MESLSSGNQQRVQLAVALVHDPDLLILDEPFRGLDPVAARTLAALLTQRAAAGAGVVFSSHQLDLVQDLCEDVTIVSDGVTVATGTVAELRARAAWRVVRITWEDPEVRWTPPPALRAAAGGRWEAPVSGDAAAGSGGCAGPRPERDVVAEPGRVRFAVPALFDPVAIAGAAAAAGRVSAISVEPPTLEEVFVDLVTARRGARG